MTTPCLPAHHLARRLVRRGAPLAALMVIVSGGLQAANDDEPQPFTQTIPGSLATIDMVPVPAGTVTLRDPADPEKVVTVEVGPFWVSRYEITWDVYDAFALSLDGDDAEEEGVDAITRPSKPYIPPDRGFGRAGYPAISMTHHAATQFCRWLSAKTGRTYRLPTEGEWEHFARAGAPPEARYYFGDENSLLDDHAWHAGNANWTTHPVGRKTPNAWGLHDIHGNVAEWCDGLDGKPVARGGSFLDGPEQLALTFRLLPSPMWNMSDPQLPKSEWWLSDCSFVGFRVICVPEQ